MRSFFPYTFGLWLTIIVMSFVWPLVLHFKLPQPWWVLMIWGSWALMIWSIYSKKRWLKE